MRVNYNKIEKLIYKKFKRGEDNKTAVYTKFANKVGFTTASVFKYLTNRNINRLDVVIKYAEALDVAPIELFEFDHSVIHEI